MLDFNISVTRQNIPVVVVGTGNVADPFTIEVVGLDTEHCNPISPLTQVLSKELIHSNRLFSCPLQLMLYIKMLLSLTLSKCPSGNIFTDASKKIVSK